MAKLSQNRKYGLLKYLTQIIFLPQGLVYIVQTATLCSIVLITCLLFLWLEAISARDTVSRAVFSRIMVL